MSRPGSASRALAGAAFAAALLGAGEIGARLAPPPSAAAPMGDPVEGSVLLNGDPWLLWSLRPGDHEEVGVPVRINALGLRDRDRGPPSRPRALTLGDSSVYGFGVRDAEVFTALLEAALPADFVNAAVPGYSTYQALNLLDMRGWALQPDLLIVGTLWSDNNFDSFSDRDLLASYAGWRASGVHQARMLLERSALFRWLDWTFRVAPQGDRARKVGWQVGGDDPRSGGRRVDINAYAENLEAFCARMHARGGGVAFLLLPNREDLEPLSGDPAWAPFRGVMRDIATRWAAPVIDGPAAFRAAGRSADALFIDQMHPSPAGHRVLADAVSKVLVDRGWPKEPMALTPPATPLPRWADRFEGKGREEKAGNNPGTPGSGGRGPGG
jgi:lysophospholipase L1-like esterase